MSAFRFDDHYPGDEDPGEFTEEWAKRWLEWTLAERLRPYIGTTPLDRRRMLQAELRAWAEDNLVAPIVMECVVGSDDALR